MSTLDRLTSDFTSSGARRAPRRRDVRPRPALPDVRRELVGNFAGCVCPDDPVGTFGDVCHRRFRATGAFAGDPDRRRQGSFGDHDLGHAA